MIKMAFYRERICEYEPQNNSIYLGIVYVCQIQLAWLIEEQKDFGPTMDQHVCTPTNPAKNFHTN